MTSLRACALRIATGARSVESALLADLAALAAEAVADPLLLAAPVRVVVPSATLRAHVCARLAGSGAVAGVTVQTLHALAAEILERCGVRRPLGAALFPVLVRRLALEEKELAGLVEGMRDGVGPVAASVRDLLDAGLEPAHAEALDERLAERLRSRSEAEVERARALVRVAARVAEAAAEAGLGLEPELLRLARELLIADPERALPSRAVFVHGFAEATGCASDLIEALVGHRAAVVYVDHPPDPALPDRPDSGVVFAARLCERLGGTARPPLPAACPPPVVALVRAPGASAEARAVAIGVRALLDGGTPPERIAVVARDLESARRPLEQQLARLAVPFSLAGVAGCPGPGSRRLVALLELLRRGEDASADTWLAAAAVLPGIAELRLGLRVCGAARLADVANLAVDELLDEHGTLPLPLRRGLAAAAESEEGEERWYAPRRRLAGPALRDACRRAAGLTAALGLWPARAALGEHLVRLREVLARHLGWTASTPGAVACEAALAALEEAVGEVRLAREEMQVLVADALDGAALLKVGGHGAGVRLYGLTEARGLTFTHLLVVGLNRDVFPRTVHEDPLLPDRIRRDLAVVLPDVPIKATGFDEERYLFAQLVSAAEHVTLSWQDCDDDGRPLAPSPLVERLRALAGLEPVVARDLFSRSACGPRPIHEHAVMAGLGGDRDTFRQVLGLALAARGVIDPSRLAAARVAVLDEIDPDPRSPVGRTRATALGPYLGLVGARTRGATWVTTLEATAACGWQAFLRRLLRLEPTPDPLAELPGADPVLVGSVVHAVLERIVRSSAPDLPERLEDALSRIPTRVGRPEPALVARLADEEARRTARAAGVALPGLQRVLAARARPYLDVALEVLWSSSGTIAAAGVEVEGHLEFERGNGARCRLSFKADLVERHNGAVCITDFKTGSPLSDGARKETRRAHLIQAIARGERLQVLAYALAGPPGAEGRYLSLKPGVAAEHRTSAVSATDADAREAFAAAVRHVLAAWELGAFLPRMMTPDGRDHPPACGWCEVADACLRDDSGACRRLVAWAGAAEGRELEGAEAAMLALWQLASAGGRKGAR